MLVNPFDDTEALQNAVLYRFAVVKQYAIPVTVSNRRFCLTTDGVGGTMNVKGKKTFPAPVLPTRQLVILAAIRCFARKGMTKTTMGDIADEAHRSRTTLYRLFPDRNALIEEILTSQFIEAIKLMKKKFVRSPSLQDALSSAPVYAIHVLRADPRFQLMLDSLGAKGYKMILDSSEQVDRYASSVWKPWLAKARERGELKSKLDDDRVLQGMLSIAGLMLVQSHLTDEERRAFLNDFFVAALR